ncbi:MAG: alpha/beta hydrolase [Candidatus Thalassarchaeaceae archaeon]
MKGTLVMLHGMTGTSNKMLPLANKLVPSNWEIFCPEAIIPHPTRGGFAWWLRDEFNDPSGPLNPLDEKSMEQARDSVTRVIEEIPEGPLIIGGFSQGGAIASLMLERSIQDRIIGLILIGTKTINPDGLISAVSKIWPRPVVWMHGEKDHLVPISVGEEHVRIFEDAFWPVTRIKHHKGHMVDISKIDELVQAIRSMA